MRKTDPRSLFRRLLTRKKGAINKEEMAGIEYEPTNVKELLTQMYDSAVDIVDLAYSAIVLDSTEMAEKVREKETEMDSMLYKIRIYSMLAARNFKEAEQLSGLLQLANCVESMSDAAADIVDLFYSDIQSRPIFSFIFKDADEKVRAVAVHGGSDLCKRIGELKIESETGVRAIAIKRGKRWLYDIGGNTRIHAKDRLVLRGVEEGLDEVEAVAQGKSKWGKYQGTKKSEGGGRTTKGAEMILNMKNTTELMVDLSISALLYNNKEIAREVYILEEEISNVYDKLIRYILEVVVERDTEFAMSLLTLTNGMEAIGDAARGIANIVLRDIEPHPVIRDSIRESNVSPMRVKIEPGSKLDDKLLGEVKLASETGMWAFAVKRGNQWIFGPNEATKIQAKDVIFTRGPRESCDELLSWAKTGK